MTELGAFYSSPGMVSEGFTLLRAEGLEKVGEGGGVEGEDIVVHRVPLGEVAGFRRGEARRRLRDRRQAAAVAGDAGLGRVTALHPSRETTEIVGVGLDFQLRLGRAGRCGRRCPRARHRPGRLQRREGQPDLLLGLGAAGPAGERIGALRAGGFELQHPLARAGPARLHRIFATAGKSAPSSAGALPNPRRQSKRKQGLAARATPLYHAADGEGREGRGISRRTLLIGGGAGVGLLVAWRFWPRSYAPNLRAAEGETIFNAFLKIGRDGRVIVAVPQTEIGQGVYTSLPQILADELGADWRTVSVEPAPISPLYANRLLAEEAADDSGWPGFLEGVGRWAARDYATENALMLTAGSTSVRAFEAPLREAGAGARALLSIAAADRWDVNWEELDTRDGFVWGPEGRIPSPSWPRRRRGSTCPSICRSAAGSTTG